MFKKTILATISLISICTLSIHAKANTVLQNPGNQDCKTLCEQKGYRNCSYYQKVNCSTKDQSTTPLNCCKCSGGCI